MRLLCGDSTQYESSSDRTQRRELFTSQNHRTLRPKKGMWRSVEEQKGVCRGRLLSALPPAQAGTKFTSTLAGKKFAILVFCITAALMRGPNPGASVATASAGHHRQDEPSLTLEATDREAPVGGKLAPRHPRSSIMHPARQQQQHQVESLGLVEPLRLSGSRSEPPSRPSVEWSKQQPKFGSDIQRNISVELGKTASLACKVYELGDKTVSWLRGDEILTSGQFTYIRDPRFSSINDQGSHEWKLEIKDVNLNDSTQYECQVSTDPKMSVVISLHVKAAKARIRQGENFYAASGSSVEFTCDLQQRHQSLASLQATRPPTQTYWYHNGNLINYLRVAVGAPGEEPPAETHGDQTSEGLLNVETKPKKNAFQMATKTNFSIDWDQQRLVSRLLITNVQPYDSGNYTCRPSAAEPATIRLHVKRYNHQRAKDSRTNAGSLHHQQLRDRPQNGQLLPADYGGQSAAVGSLQIPKTWGQLTVVLLLACLWANIAATTSRTTKSSVTPTTTRTILAS